MSLTIEPGQTVAIVGHTGAGKTTLTSLMMRFYDVTAGRILLDGVDLREQNLSGARQHFAVVLQDPFLFSGTLAETSVWHNEIGEEIMRQAARDVNVLDFIESLPGGFDEPVRERGNSLSTGQKQPHQLARALAYNPRISFSTSHIERGPTRNCASRRARTDGRGQDQRADRARLSTVQRAETILVMHKGQFARWVRTGTARQPRPLLEALIQLQYKDQETASLRRFARASAAQHFE